MAGMKRMPRHGRSTWRVVMGVVAVPIRSVSRVVLACIGSIRQRMGELVTGVVVGIISTIAFQAILDFTPFYHSKLRPDPLVSPRIELGEAVATEEEGVLRMKIEQRVRNRGLRPGRFSRVEITAEGLLPGPKVEVTVLDRETFWPWQSRMVTTRITIHERLATLGTRTTLRLDYFDDAGELAFSHRLYDWPLGQKQPPSPSF
jgi:hypothetical protein